MFVLASSVQRKRAILTVAAIAWGTVAIVMLLAFGEGLKRQMNKNRMGTGENLVLWIPDSTSVVWQGLPRGRYISPRLDDLEYLRERVPDARVEGEIHTRATFTYGRQTQTARLIGASHGFGEIRKHFAQAGGRFFNANDEAEKRRVVFLGNDLADGLFEDEEPVGKTVMINNVPYLVIGVIIDKIQMGNYGGMDADHGVIPITTFAAQWGRQRLNYIVMQVDGPDVVADVVERFNNALSARYRYDPADPQVSDVIDFATLFKAFGNVIIGFQIFLGVVGGLTLLVGGIGVANIMYAVVKEKTREIGVQMAIGARRGWITGPLVLQGLAYTLLGGMVGVVISVVLITIAGQLPTEGIDALQFLGTPTLSWGVAIATAIVLGAIGTLAGYFPARRAAGIDPAETLRYE
jgi:putative ABC transport system permease protein